MKKGGLGAVTARHRIANACKGIVRHGALLIIAFVILQPMLMLVSAAGKNLYQLIDPQVTWLPIPYHVENLTKAFEVLGGMNSLVTSIALVTGVSILQTLCCALTGYGLTNNAFPGQKLIFAVMVFTFFIPKEVSFLPQYVQFLHYGILGTALTKLLPTLFGQGIRSALMIMLFCQFYRQLPRSLQESAWIDGAGYFKSLVKINIPMLVPAMIVCFVVTFAWEWNDTYFSATFFRGNIPLMSLKLQDARALFLASAASGPSVSADDSFFHQGIQAAAALLVVLPLIIMYLIFERHLIEGIDRAGITGE